MQLAVVHDNFIHPVSFSDGIVMIVQGESGGGENGVNPHDGEFSWYDSNMGNILSGFVDAYQESDYNQSTLSTGLYNWQDLTGYVYITPFDDNGEYTFPFHLYTVNNNVTDQLVGLATSDFYNLNTKVPLTQPEFQSSIFTINDDVNESALSFTSSLTCQANKLYLSIITFYCQINRRNNYDVRSIPYLDVNVTNANYQSDGRTDCINFTSSSISLVKVFSLSTTGTPTITVSKGVNNTFVPDGLTVADETNTISYVNNRTNVSGNYTYNQNTIRLLEINQIHYN